MNNMKEKYDIKQAINYVKNSGAAYADFIFSINSEASHELTASMAFYKSGVEINSKSRVVNHINDLNGKVICLRLPIAADGEITVKATICETARPNITISEKERIIYNKSSFADTSNIKLKHGGILDVSQQTGLEYILGVDVARLLQPAYEMHGIPLVYEDGVDVGQDNDIVSGMTVRRYGGWERKGANNWTENGGEDTFTLAGEHMGHWMSAAAVFYHALKNNENYHDEIKKLAYRMDYIVGKLDALRNLKPAGNALAVSKEYIGGCPEETFIKCFNGDANWADGYWVPWYGLHKIYQGLLDVYDYARDDTAIKSYIVLKRFSDWAVRGTSLLNDAQMQKMLDIEHGGMNEIFARMYEITGEQIYLDAARRFTHDSVINPLVSASSASLSGLHANTQIPKFVGAAKLYEQDKIKYADYKTACENFWYAVNYNRCYAIGGNSIAEHFEKSESSETLGIKTCESCNTYNMMRLTEYLFSWEQKSEYMDWYEKALYNHILGQQEPETGAKMYFVSLLQGHHRIYEEKYNSWWCCTGTGMENPGRYTRTAYFEDNINDILYINLYMSGTYTWSAKQVTFNVETEYPYSDKVKITVEAGNNINAQVKLRAPGWLSRNMTASVNSEIIGTSAGGEYLSIHHTWNKGDVIEAVIPMDVSVYKSREKNQIAYQYGPVVLAADLGSCSEYPQVHEYTQNETMLDSITTNYPYIKTNGSIKYASFVEADNTAKLMFHIKAQNSSINKDIPLKPFYEIHHCFHNVYWDLDNKGDTFSKWLNDIQIDRVEPDGQQDEIGHGLTQNSESKNGNYYQSHQGSLDGQPYFWRDAFGSADAFFQYIMKVDGTIQNYLFVRYWGNDGEICGMKRDFKIYANNIEIARQTLNAGKPNDTICVFYKIPRDITDNRDTIVIKFAPTDKNSIAGRYLEMRITKEKI